jgi:hypothetical protein
MTPAQRQCLALVIRGLKLIVQALESYAKTFDESNPRSERVPSVPPSGRTETHNAHSPAINRGRLP